MLSKEKTMLSKEKCLQAINVWEETRTHFTEIRKIIAKITIVKRQPYSSIENTINGIKNPPIELPPITQLIAVDLL